MDNSFLLGVSIDNKVFDNISMRPFNSHCFNNSIRRKSETEQMQIVEIENLLHSTSKEI